MNNKLKFHENFLFILLSLFFLILSYISYIKSVDINLQIWAKYLYSMQYENFLLIKRGFIGEFFHLFFPRINSDIVFGAYIMLLSLFIIINSFLFSYIFIKARKNKLLIFVILMYFVTSSFYSTLSYNIGYPDLYIFIISLVVLYFLLVENFIIAAFFSIIGIMIHEIFIFEYLSLLLISYMYHKKYEKKLGVLFILLLIFYVFLNVETKHANIFLILKENNFFNMDYNYINTIVNVQFGQTVLSAFTKMIKLFNLKIFLINIFFYLLFPIVTIFFFLPKINKKFFILYILSIFSFLIIFCFAWDLSRLLQYIIFNFLLASIVILTRFDIKWNNIITKITYYTFSFIIIVFNILLLLIYSYFNEYSMVINKSSVSNYLKDNIMNEKINKILYDLYYKGRIKFKVLDLPIGKNGIRGNNFVANKKNKKDNLVLYGPYIYLPKGKFSLKIYYKCEKSNVLPFYINILNQRFKKIKVNSVFVKNSYVQYNFYNKNNLDRYEFQIRMKKNNDIKCKFYYYELRMEN